MFYIRYYKTSRVGVGVFELFLKCGEIGKHVLSCDGIFDKTSVYVDRSKVRKSLKSRGTAPLL